MKRLALSIMALGTSIFAGGDLSEYGYKSGDLNSADIASLREELSTLKSTVDGA